MTNQNTESTPLYELLDDLERTREIMGDLKKSIDSRTSAVKKLGSGVDELRITLDDVYLTVVMPNRQ